jgi:hypothetical protein
MSAAETRPPIEESPRSPVASIAALLRRLSRYWIVPAALAAASAFWIGQQWGAGRLDGRSNEVAKKIATYENAIATGRKQKRDRPKIEADLDGILARTLGSDLESTDSALRARLNRLGEEAGLSSSLVVSTQAPSTRGTPAKSEFGRTGVQRQLRDEPDFVELPASVSVQGPLEPLLRLAHRLEAEPWIKRIDSFRLDRAGADDRMKLDLRLTTIFVPGRAAAEDAELPGSEAPTFDRYAMLVASNPFASPPAPEPRRPRDRRRETPPPPPPGPPPFPYGEWILTGIVEGPIGREAWLRHRSSGETLALSLQGKVGDAELQRIEGDRAEFALAGESFAVLVGGSLVDRYPLRQ